MAGSENAVTGRPFQDRSHRPSDRYSNRPRPTHLYSAGLGRAANARLRGIQSTSRGVARETICWRLPNVSLPCALLIWITQLGWVASLAGHMRTVHWQSSDDLGSLKQEGTGHYNYVAVASRSMVIADETALAETQARSAYNRAVSQTNQ